ncbi:MAG: [FeFe] hydrogenase, group A [Megasphaera sp.]|jgi:NADH-quinone oxidoreductase subunit G/NADP-reducing hydrogenase subunit HndD|uniref:NADH-dependent [FeFe] hydrogenase, group A6 n=1 Tax=Megasphaera sueciensis TaxID=349094 RepID=UPI003CFF9B40|nr:[FeFe] hydrogenase, group A [Megasphaera sp.]MCI1822951.1 [FeFe] hydrogenase, group A [Megasphaera sp.]
MKTVSLTINGIVVKAPQGFSILEAARSAGIYIPTLCYHPDLVPEGACRMCIVDVSGVKTLVASCMYPVEEGMIVKTNTAKVREARRMVIELLLANHPKNCLTCRKNGDCELQTMAADMGVRTHRFDWGERKIHTFDASNPCLVRDQEKCILCGRCIRVCRDIQQMNVYSFANRGFNSIVSTAFEQDLSKVACTYCGQCASLCPTGAIVEKDDTERVWEAINDPEKVVVVQVAPSVRVALGEEMGMEAGSIVTGKMVAALRNLGFDKVFDTNFSADLTIMEEGFEFLDRLTKGGVLPMITSCSPGWVNMCELKYPDLLNHLSTAKSPQGMFGTVIKTYFAHQAGIDPAHIVSVSVMPCTAKKAECVRPQLRDSGYQDVDIVITTRELGRMLREAGIDFRSIRAVDFDSPLGYGSGAGAIFGSSGGVMEAALRTVADVVTGQDLWDIEYTEIRGLDRTKEAQVQLGDKEIRIAVCNSLGAAQKMMDRVRKGTASYHFIEIMACPGGCIGGGGQPVPTNMDIKKKRAEALYKIDEYSQFRKSHENPDIKTIYKEWLGQPLSEKSHHYLHTTYGRQER